VPVPMRWCLAAEDLEEDFEEVEVVVVASGVSRLNLCGRRGREGQTGRGDEKGDGALLTNRSGSSSSRPRALWPTRRGR